MIARWAVALAPDACRGNAIDRGQCLELFGPEPR
jgi:hypothetical protein